MPTVLALDRVLARQTIDAFGRYELLGRLGAGGMAEVFVARCGDVEGMQSLAAVKRILPHLADDEGFVALFRREAQISLRLRHRAIARVFEVGRVDTAWFLAMELVPGESLSHLLRAEKEHGAPVDPRLVAWVGAEIASALHHAHGLMEGATPLEVIHRDVSPQNLLLGFDGAPKLIDFGVARCVRLSNATRTGTVRGKLSYASPEQLGARRLDGRSDLFSLGVVLHEWLSGRPLFARDSEAATVQAVQLGLIPRIPSAPKLSAVLSRALERSPDRRFPDGEAMADALLEAVGGRPPSPERLVAAHLAARFPERKLRWEKIIAGGEMDLPPVAVSLESRSSTVRHSLTTSSLTSALPAVAAAVDVAVEIPAGPANGLAHAPFAEPSFSGEPTQSKYEARVGQRTRRRAGSAVAAAAVVASLAGLVGTWVWRDHERGQRDAATARTRASFPPGAGAILGNTTATTVGTEGSPGPVIPSSAMLGSSVGTLAEEGSSGRTATSRADAEPARTADSTRAPKSGETARHVSRRHLHRGGGISSAPDDGPAPQSRLRHTVVDELEPSPYQKPQ